MRYLFFPLKPDAKERVILKEFKGSIEERNFQKIEKTGPKNLKAILKKVVPESKWGLLPRSFDVVGDILILELPEELEKLEKSIAWNVKQAYPTIKVVAKKANKTTGVYRIRQIKVLQGENRTETVHKESGLKMHIDLNKAYFSPRLGSERLRISKQIKEDEDVLVMFAGVGPQALVIAKEHPSAMVWAIEINPDAVKMMKENIRINYLGDRVVPLLGDAEDIVPKLVQKFNRIIMILPHEDEKFLPLALTVAKKGCTLHMYAIAKEDEFEKLKKRLEAENPVKVKQVLKAGEYSPYVYRVCAEMEVI